MSKSANHKQDLFHLLHWLIYGELNEAEFARLEQRLLGDPGARQLYREFIGLQLGLYSRYSVVALGNRQVLPESEEPQESLESMSETSPTVDAEKLQAIQAQAERKLQSFLAEQERLRRAQEQQAASRTLRSFDVYEATRRLLRKIDNVLSFAAKLTVASAVGLALTLLIAVSVQSWLKHRVVAVLGESIHAQWVQTPETRELCPGTLSLEQGYAQLVFKKGAEVIVQAPCHLHLHSPNKMTLESGTVTAKVPEAARGFTIETPSSRVVDYGTEFGVLMDAANQAEIHVFEGEVIVQSTAKTQRSKTYRLKKGQNALANWTAGIQVGKAKHSATHFVRQMPDPNGPSLPGKRIDLADIVGGGMALARVKRLRIGATRSAPSIHSQVR